MNIKSKEIEKSRRNWSEVAKKNNWYKEPFYIQIWVDKDGNITDSVSVIGLKRDYIIDSETDRPLKKTQYTIV